jgi:hypothetical protein
MLEFSDFFVGIFELMLPYLRVSLARWPKR